MESLLKMVSLRLLISTEVYNELNSVFHLQNVSRNNLVKRTDGSRADIDVNQDQAVAMVLEGTGTHHYRSRHAQKSPENSQRTAQDDSLDGHDQHKQHHAHSKT